MKSKVFTAVTVFLLLNLRLFAQGNTVIYAELQKGDSVDKAVQSLSSELRLVLPGSYPVESPASFRSDGILVLTLSQAVKYKIKIPSALKTYGPEGIYIKGDSRSVILVGNTGLALQEAVTFYLENLGFHQFIPGPEWKIVPKISSPFRKINLLTKPDFEYRFIANGHAYGNSFKIATDFVTWANFNRMGGSFPVKSGHSYEEIVQRNEALFRKHPEYFGQKVAAGTLPAEFKFNVGNKELVDFIVKDAFYRYEMQQKTGDMAPMVSMEPSDGGAYCDKPECLAIGNASDQAFYLSNIVARAFQKKYPGVWIGGFAYNQHILPPKAPLEKNIFITITNGFNNSKYSTLELLKLWQGKVSRTGVYDYISVFEWDNDLPGKVQAAHTASLRKNVRNFYKNGAKVYIGESVMGWISKGPGQYVLSKMLWNTNVNTDSLKNLFFTTAFETVAPLIRKLYQSWEEYPYTLPADNDMADWLQWIDEAYRTTPNPAVKKRIDLIKIYMNYLVLMRNLRKDKTEENLLKLMNYAYRTFETAAFPTLAVMVSLPAYYGHSELGWNMSPDQKWKKDNRPVSDAELQASFNQALQTIKRTEGVVPFAKAKSFIRLSSLVKIPERKYNQTPHGLWFPTEYIIQISKQGAGNYLEIKSDFSAQPPQAKPVEIMIYPLEAPKNEDEEVKPLLKFEQIKQQVNERFSLAALKPGTYRMVVDDKRKVYILGLSPEILYSYVAGYGSNINSTSIAGLNWFYFYVPPGVKRFQMSKTNGFLLESPTGRLIDKQQIRDETFFVDVQNNESGIWTIGMQGGIVTLDGVPAYLGDHPSTMLVPAYLKK